MAKARIGRRKSFHSGQHITISRSGLRAIVFAKDAYYTLEIKWSNIAALAKKQGKKTAFPKTKKESTAERKKRVKLARESRARWRKFLALEKKRSRKRATKGKKKK